MSSYQTIETPQDYVNYTFNISARGVTEAAGEMAGLSNTITTILGQMAFKTAEYLTHTESLMIGLGTVSTAAFASATQQAIKFEQAVANVQAIGGEAINAMKIGEAAMKYSSQFGMDVNSMTEGLEALSRAGLTATNVMSGVLAEGVKLSKLESIDLEESINNLISTTNLLATSDMDINSQEYADAVKAMNQHIVSTSESAPINAENIFQTLQHVGGYASANSIDQDDLFAVIAQLGAKGTKGEMAGTALRAFIAAGQKDQAQRALARIGLNVSDLWNEAGDAMLPISEMKDVIDTALEARGYSKQEKLEFYSDFAGYKQANQIMKIDTSEVQEYKESIAQAWDLGKKLETILGTTNNNLQILFQTTKNFMTKVGSTMLPIINAIIIPIKLGVQLLEKIPFSENITGLLLTMAGIKAVLLFINRVLPTLASMYTSFSKGEKEAGKIRKHFSHMVKDLQEAKNVLSNLGDPIKMSQIRLKNGFMGEQSYKVHKEVTKELYGDYYASGANPNLPEWNELTPVEQNSVIETMEAYKSTDTYQQKLDEVVSKYSKITENIGEFLLNEQIIPTSTSTTLGKKVTSSPKSKRDINQEISINQKSNESQFKHATPQIPITSGADVFKPQTDNEVQNNIAQGILSVKGPLAEAIGRALSQSINVESMVVSDTLGTFQVDKIKGDKIASQLQEIENNVSDHLGDIGYFLDYDLEKIDRLLANVKFDLQRKITAYSNNDPNFMNAPQEARMKKIISGAARTNLGKLYSEEQNSIDILNALRGEKWNEPEDKRLGIHNLQMKAMEDALGFKKNRDDLDRVDRLNNIHKELNRQYKGKAKDAKIAEILEITAQTWRDEIAHDMPGAGASKYLTNDRAALIGNSIGIQGIDWNNTDNAAQQLIDYFKDTQDGTRKAQQLRDADNLMFAIMEQAKGENAVFNQMEADELGYIIRRYRQLLLARNKKLEEENKTFAMRDINDFLKDDKYKLSTPLEDKGSKRARAIADEMNKKSNFGKFFMRDIILALLDEHDFKDSSWGESYDKQLQQAQKQKEILKLTNEQREAYNEYVGGRYENIKGYLSGKNPEDFWEGATQNEVYHTPLSTGLTAKEAALILLPLMQQAPGLLEDSILWHGGELNTYNNGIGFLPDIRSLSYLEHIAESFIEFHPERYKTKVYAPAGTPGLIPATDFGDFHANEEEYTIPPSMYFELIRDDVNRYAEILIIPFEKIKEILKEIDFSELELLPDYWSKSNMKRFVESSHIMTDTTIKNLGESTGDLIKINPNLITKYARAGAYKSIPQGILEVYMHEAAHNLLQHNLRASLPNAKGFGLPELDFSWEGYTGQEVIAEFEADSVLRQLQMSKGIKPSPNLKKRWTQMKDVLEQNDAMQYVNEDFINTIATEMNSFSEQFFNNLTDSLFNNTDIDTSSLNNLYYARRNYKTFAMNYRDFGGQGQFPGMGELTPDEQMFLSGVQPVNVSVDFPDKIEVSFENTESEKLTSIRENVQKLTDTYVKDTEDKEGLVTVDEPRTLNNVQFVVQGDLHITDTGKILTPDVVINTDGVTVDTQEVPALKTDAMSFDQKTIEQLETMFPKYEDLKFAITEEIYSAAAASVTAMLSTIVDNVEFEINSLREFVSTFLFFTKGIEIVDNETKKQEDEAQQVIDDFNIMTKGIATQWLQLSIIVQSFLDLFEEQEKIEENLKNQMNELNQNVPRFAEYLLGHSLVSIEDVSDELSQYVKDTIKNVIDEVFNPPEKFVQIPTESTGTLEELKEKNRKARIKDSGEEIIIGRYRVPGGPPGGVMPKNLMPGGYPQTVKDQLEQNRLNRLSQKDTDAQAQRYAHAKAKSDAEAMADDLLSTAHNIHNELATRHIKDPNSLTQNELDFIGLNKERDERRRKKRDNDVTIEDLEKARIGTTWTQHHKSEIQKDKDRKDRLRRGATNEDITRPPSVVDHRQYEKPIGPNKPSTGKEMAAKILGKSLDEIDKTSQKLRDERYDEKIIELVDKNFINEEEPYVPTAHMYPTTGIGQASALYKENQAINELIDFYQSQEQIVEARNNLALENENKKLENIEKERKNLLREEENAKYRDWHRNEIRRKYETAPWTLTDKDLRKIGVDPTTVDRTPPKKQPSQEFLDKQARADAFWADIEELEKKGEKDAFWADIERQEKEAEPSNKERADAAVARMRRQKELNKQQQQRQRQLELRPIKKEIQEELNTVKDAFTLLMDTDKKMVEKSQTLNPMRKQSEFWDSIDKLEQEGIQEEKARKRKEKVEKADKAAAQVRMGINMQALEQQYDDYMEQASQNWRIENFKRRFYQGKEERDAKRDKRKADEKFWKDIEKLETQGIREQKNAPAFNEAQQELLTVAQNITIARQKNAAQQEFIQAQKDLLNVAKNITEEEERLAEIERQKEIQEKRLKYLEDLKEDINNVNQFWEDSSNALYGASGFLDGIGETVDKFVKIFPPLAVISTPINIASQKMKDLVEVFEIAQEAIGTFKVLNSDMTKEEAESVGLGKEYANAQLIKRILGDNTFVGPFLEGLGVNVTAMFDIGKTLMSIIAKELGVFIASNAALILPPLAAIAAAVGVLYAAEQMHAKALKEATEAQEKTHKELTSSYLTYKNLHDARTKETDAMKRQQLARKESIALYNLEADRINNINAINEKTKLRNDALWGEYGMRAQYQKMGWGEAFMSGNVVGLIAKWLSGDFESQADNYDGTTKQIRLLKESSLAGGHGLLGGMATSYAASWYDANKMQLGQIEAFGPQLQELYDKESLLIEKYGSIEAARDSKEFKEAVQEFADATGLNSETAQKYLDYLQTERNVELATNVMQAQISGITAKAYAKVAENEYGGMANMGDMDNLQSAMIFANFDQMWKDAYNEMFWNMLMEYLQAIISLLMKGPLGIGDAYKHLKNASAYGEAQAELLTKGNEIYQSGVDVAKENQRTDYGTEQSLSYYGDSPTGAAKESSAAAEDDYALEVMHKNRKKYYNAARNNGHAAVSGFKDGLDQHSPGKIARSIKDEMKFTKQFIEKGNPVLLRSFGTISEGATNIFSNIGEGVDWVGNTIFNALASGSGVFNGAKKAFNKPQNIQVDNSKTEIHIHTININTEDDPEKIKTAFMNLMVELGEQVVPRQVSRTVGQTVSTDNNVQSGIENINPNDSSSNPTTPNNNPNNNPNT